MSGVASAPGRESLHRQLIRPETRLLVLQLALPHYRQGLIRQLSAHPSVLFATGDSQAQVGVVRGVAGANVVRLPPNIFLFGRRLIWLRVPFRSAMVAPIVAIELNPRILNGWLILLGRRIARKRTIAWGHVYPRQGKGSSTDRIRNLMRRLLDGLIVYTAEEAREFRLLHESADVFIASNAVYSSTELAPTRSRGPRSDFILIGRLVDGKKPMLALQAFKEFVRTQTDARLVIIGAGPEAESLAREAQAEIAAGTVVLEGEVTDVSQLGEAFSRAVAMVASGYVGLNATQSVGFGVPVIYPDNEPHAPEVEILDDSNSWEFVASDAFALVRAMRTAWDSRELVDARAEQISRPVREKYTTEAMAQAFLEAAT